MKTVLDQATRAELISRINLLNENSQPQWGKMTVYQMLKHCRLWEEMVFGRRRYPRAFIGLVFGRIALRTVLKDETPLRRNSPTIPDLVITGSGDLSAERTKWLALIDEYTQFTDPAFIHPFFGKMTREQIGYMAYKHTDHHLRQFNC